MMQLLALLVDWRIRRNRLKRDRKRQLNLDPVFSKNRVWNFR